MARAKPRTVPLLPLPRGSVLLPGATLRIPIANRADVASLLANLYSRAASPRSESPITIGCVPLSSPLLSKDGRQMIENSKDTAAQNVRDTEDLDPQEATKDDLFGWGCMAKITNVQGRRSDEMGLVVVGLQRIRIEKVTQEQPFFEAAVEYFDEPAVDTADSAIVDNFGNLKRLSRELLALVRLSAILPRVPSSIALSPILARRLELYVDERNVADAGTLADFMANILDGSHDDKLRILSSPGVRYRLERTVELLERQIKNFQTNRRIIVASTKAENNLDLDKLRQLQRAALRRGSNSGSLPGGMGFPVGFGGGGQQSEEEPNEMDELKKRIEEAKLTPEASKVAQRELQRLQKMNPAQAEYQVCRNYLENLAEIPWSKMTEDNLNKDTLKRARKQLDDDHYGLEKIKKRLLEYLAVLKLKQAVNADLESQIKRITDAAKAAQPKEEGKDVKEDVALAKTEDKTQSEEELALLNKKRMVDKSPILLLVGPPGTGKTSLAKSVATALGRKFHRISLGGVRDEAEIRGHRRTYVAAMPGLIINGLKKAGVANPVFLLDEIDKLGMSNFHGDPSAAMLEVLDPEQNHTFSDHYVNIPVDLSKVLFIATANSLDTIPPPLLDRMETIQLSGYTNIEKRHIANRHLIPKQITTNGLQPSNVKLPEDVLDKIITAYTRESGVRNLEREIGSVCRYKAVEYSDSKDAQSESQYSPTVTIDDLDIILGTERFMEELAEQSSRPGVVTGLVAYSTGGQGSILFIEVADMPGSGRVQLTGKLGDVLKESVEVALSWVKAHAWDLALTHDPAEDIMKSRAIHVHCPSGAIPKDGPSAGLAHTIALISLFSNKPVPPTLAMTGEMSLRGRVLPVGGIKEKLIGALRAGVEKVLLPEQNKKDARDLPEEVTKGLQIVYVSHIWEALKQVWPEESWGGRANLGGLEPRL